VTGTPPAFQRGERTSIRVDKLGVRYSLRFTRKTTLRQSFTRRVKRPDAGGDGYFWALRDLSFKVVHGESLAVIGPNGAGKSTLLQVLAGIITPSEGVVDVDGHVSSLLTLGAGFDSDLSGIDNIRLAGAFMGLDHKWLDERLPSIVDYADLGQFIDAPLKTYSSGMRARLGFAIATSVEPDILLLDEVLSTGDAAFRAKSKQRVLELVKSAKAIVLVTHDMQWVTEYCNRAMLLEKGHVVAEGDPAEVVRIHQEHSAQRRAEREAAGVLADAKGPLAAAAKSATPAGPAPAVPMPAVPMPEGPTPSAATTAADAADAISPPQPPAPPAAPVGR
jgi:ABC-2 type transport system ATP-binding protein